MNSDRKINWCTGLLDRIRYKLEDGTVLNLYENCVRSLLELKQPNEEWVFCVADYESRDMDPEDLFQNLKKEYKDIDFTYKIVKYPRKEFTRGGGRNRAVEIAEDGIIFFLDADMLFTARDVIDNTYKHVAEGKVYFPMCSDYNDITHKAYLRREGTGNMGIDKQLFDNCNYPYLEKNTWGGEDDKMFNYFSKNKKIATRDYTCKFFHQWHPRSTHGQILDLD